MLVGGRDAALIDYLIQMKETKAQRLLNIFFFTHTVTYTYIIGKVQREVVPRCASDERGRNHGSLCIFATCLIGLSDLSVEGNKAGDVICHGVERNGGAAP